MTNKRKSHLLQILFLFGFCFWTTLTWSKTWNLDQVIRSALKNNRTFLIIQKKIESDELIRIHALAPYDWVLGASFNHPRKKWKFESDEFYWTSSPFLQKKFSSGTTLKMIYFNTYSLPDLKTFSALKNSYPVHPSYSQGLSLQLEQNLLRNFFGRDDRLKIKSANYRYKSVHLSRKEELKQLIIESANKFWNSYIAYINLEQAKRRTKDYKELVRIARKKDKLGHSQPGEIHQILSQYEQALKTQRQVKTQLKNANIQLKTFLQIPNTSFKFKNHKPKPLPKKQKIKNTDSLTLIQIAKMNFLSEKAQLDSEKYFYLPYLKLKTQADISGFHPDNSREAFENLKSKEVQNYIIGLELTYPIPSSFSKWKKINFLKAQKIQKELEYQEKKELFSNQLKSSWNSLKSAHQSMISVIKVAQLQRKALNEIRRSYIQGRTPINVLISTQDRNAQIELEKIQAQKNYNLALLNFYKLRDQLLSRYSL